MTIDWDCLLTKARQAGGYRGLLVGLAVIRDLMASELPKNVAREICQDRKALALASQVQDKLSVGGGSLSAHNGAFSAREQWRFHLHSRERLRDRLPYARNLISERARPRDLLRAAYYAARRSALGERA
jgi:hypothetical protein